MPSRGCQGRDMSVDPNDQNVPRTLNYLICPLT
jgi:hypothetical protein